MLLQVAFLSAAGAQETWTLRTSGTEELLTSVAHGSGRFVAVGTEGVILTSTDGETWSGTASGTSASFRAVIHANGIFVAVGTQGTIRTSPDGLEWTARVSGTSAFLSGVAFGNGTFVAVGSVGVAVRSADGITWSPSGSTLTSQFLQSVAFGGGTFVAVGGNGTIRTSADGMTWSRPRSGVSRFLNGIGYFDGSFYAVGQLGTILSSSDAETWTFVEATTTWMRAVGTDGSQVVITGDNGEVLTSPDGASWTPQTSGVTRMLSAITFADNIFVTVGEPDGIPLNGLILTAPTTNPQDPDSDSDGDGLLDTWEIAHFGAIETHSGLDDPDMDMVLNIFEFLHDLDPNTFDGNSPRLPRLESVAGPGKGQMQNALVWTQHADRAAAANAFVSYSDSMLQGSWMPLGAQVEVLSTDGDLETVRVLDPDPLSTIVQRFYRMEFPAVP